MKQKTLYFDSLAWLDFVIGLSALALGRMGVLFAIIIPYFYEKWKESLLEIRIPENDPPGKNRRYIHTEENEQYEIPKGKFRVKIKAVSGIYRSEEKEFALINSDPNLEYTSLTG